MYPTNLPISFCCFFNFILSADLKDETHNLKSVVMFYIRMSSRPIVKCMSIPTPILRQFLTVSFTAISKPNSTRLLLHSCLSKVTCPLVVVKWALPYTFAVLKTTTERLIFSNPIREPRRHSSKCACTMHYSTLVAMVTIGGRGSDIADSANW